MRDNDYAAFAGILDDVCSVLSRGTYQANPRNTALYFRALAGYPLDVVRAALDAHVRDPQRGRFVPVPADILTQIAEASEQDGRPGTEHAWALVQAGFDERASINWTDEMAAAFAACRPVHAAGDEIGARMAFREVYVLEVAKARQRGTPLAWSLSPGHNPGQRAEAVRLGRAQGLTLSRVGLDEALDALPAPGGVDNAFALLAAPPKGEESEAARAGRDGLREIAERLRTAADESARLQQQAVDRAATAVEKARQATLVAQRAAEDARSGMPGHPAPTLAPPPPALHRSAA